jgi:hypothetical protein
MVSLIDQHSDADRPIELNFRPSLTVTFGKRRLAAHFISRADRGAIVKNQLSLIRAGA